VPSLLDLVPDTQRVRGAIVAGAGRYLDALLQQG
jgi:hypothetical protein